MSKISKKGEVDYSKGKIYIIKNNQNSKVYIGSTTWDISKRFNEHKRGTTKTRSQNFPLYTAMTELGVDCFYWEEIELFPCDNVSQLQAREGYWIREYNSWNSELGYNKRLEQRTKQVYYQDNKEVILEKSKQYHSDNKEKRNIFYNQVKTCECGVSYTVANKARHEKSKRHLELLLE